LKASGFGSMLIRLLRERSSHLVQLLLLSPREGALAVDVQQAALEIGLVPLRFCLRRRPLLFKLLLETPARVLHGTLQLAPLLGRLFELSLDRGPDALLPGQRLGDLLQAGPSERFASTLGPEQKSLLEETLAWSVPVSPCSIGTLRYASHS
jgi:hypothetical protein